jgi:hypothetical protein
MSVSPKLKFSCMVDYKKTFRNVSALPTTLQVVDCW